MSEPRHADAPCPFCGSAAIVLAHDRACGNSDCPIGHQWIPMRKWNSRPLRPAAWAIISERGGIFKMTIQRDSALRKLEKKLADDRRGDMTFTLEPLYLYK